MSDTPFIERTLSGLGIDRAVGWTAAARLWSILAGPVSVILIAAHLSAEEQGFYYTFASIVAFQVMFELGLGMVIVQFASHEKAFLEWRPDGTLGGSEVEKGRLAALLRKTLQWYAVATTLAAAALLLGGTLFFAHQSTTVQPTTVEGWSWPWIALAILAGGTLFLTPFLSLLEGCGLIIEVARVRTWQVMANRQTRPTLRQAGCVLDGVRRLPRRRGLGSDVHAGVGLDGAGRLRLDAVRDHGRTPRFNGSPVPTCGGV